MSATERSTTSLWLATSPKTECPRLDRDQTVDVAILGGGIVGLTAAFLLSSMPIAGPAPKSSGSRPAAPIDKPGMGSIPCTKVRRPWTPTTTPQRRYRAT
jgi:glycine/D-amino acid oxidase-like deaminating enzyme